MGVIIAYDRSFEINSFFYSKINVVFLRVI